MDYSFCLRVVTILLIVVEVKGGIANGVPGGSSSRDEARA